MTSRFKTVIEVSFSFIAITGFVSFLIRAGIEVAILAITFRIYLYYYYYYDDDDDDVIL